MATVVKSAVRALGWKVDRARICDDGKHWVWVRCPHGYYGDFLGRTRIAVLRTIVRHARAKVVNDTLRALKS